MHLNQFQNVNPERGRKLFSWYPYWATHTGNFRTWTPKGDGNRTEKVSSSIPSAFQNVNPERGRKLRCKILVPLAAKNISEREPRKGTETRQPNHLGRNLVLVFQNVNPERGRKRLIRHVYLFFAQSYFRTWTPKGDGNSRPTLNTSFSARISEREPRKGTEQAMISYWWNRSLLFMCCLYSVFCLC